MGEKKIFKKWLQMLPTGSNGLKKLTTSFTSFALSSENLVNVWIKSGMGPIKLTYVFMQNLNTPYLWEEVCKSFQWNMSRSSVCGKYKVSPEKHQGKYKGVNRYTCNKFDKLSHYGYTKNQKIA